MNSSVEKYPAIPSSVPAAGQSKSTIAARRLWVFPIAEDGGLGVNELCWCW